MRKFNPARASRVHAPRQSAKYRRIKLHMSPALSPFRSSARRFGGGVIFQENGSCKTIEARRAWIRISQSASGPEQSLSRSIGVPEGGGTSATSQCEPIKFNRRYFAAEYVTVIAQLCSVLTGIRSGGPVQIITRWARRFLNPAVTVLSDRPTSPSRSSCWPGARFARNPWVINPGRRVTAAARRRYEN
jgi:hypothetical protein